MNPTALTVFVDRAYLVFFANCEPQLTGCYIADTRAALTPLWVDDAAESCGTSNLVGDRRPSLDFSVGAAVGRRLRRWRCGLAHPIARRLEASSP